MTRTHTVSERCAGCCTRRSRAAPPPRTSDAVGTADVERHGCGWQLVPQATVAVDTAAEVEEAVVEEAEVDATWMKLVVESN